MSQKWLGLGKYKCIWFEIGSQTIQIWMQLRLNYVISIQSGIKVKYTPYSHTNIEIYKPTGKCKSYLK